MDVRPAWGGRSTMADFLLFGRHIQIYLCIYWLREVYQGLVPGAF
ncbi:MAG: hypothetical protein VCG02_19380 [Verrucomicrobiota bacterium]